MNTPNPEASPPSRVASGWITVLLIALAAAVGQAFGRFSYGVLLPAIRDDLGITNTIAGLIGASNVSAYLVGTMLVAWATSRFRLLHVMRFGLVFATFGLFLVASTKDPLMLALGLSVAGLGGAFLWIPAPVIAADALPDSRRHLAVGMMGSGIGFGIMFASVLSGTLRASHGDGAWSDVYLVQFSIGLGLLVLTFFLVRHRQGAPQGGAGLGGISALQRMAGWAPLIIAYSAFGFMYLLIMGFLTTRLEDDSLWTSGDAAFAFTLMGFSMIFGGPTFASIAKRFGARVTISVAFGLWPIFVGIVLTGQYLPVLVASIGLGFLFSALPSLITLYVVENTSPQDYGPAFAAATLAFGIAQTVSPPIGGWIADQNGSFALVFMLSALVSVLGLMASLRLPSNV